MNTTNLAVKQGRLWRDEVQEMARRKKPVQDTTVLSMAEMLVAKQGFVTAENICPENLPRGERIVAIINYLRGVPA